MADEVASTQVVKNEGIYHVCSLHLSLFSFETDIKDRDSRETVSIPPYRRQSIELTTDQAPIQGTPKA